MSTEDDQADDEEGIGELLLFATNAVPASHEPWNEDLGKRRLFSENEWGGRRRTYD